MYGHIVSDSERMIAEPVNRLILSLALFIIVDVPARAAVPQPAVCVTIDTRLNAHNATELADFVPIERRQTPLGVKRRRDDIALLAVPGRETRVARQLENDLRERHFNLQDCTMA